jgi:hypothetical protein
MTNTTLAMAINALDGTAVLTGDATTGLPIADDQPGQQLHRAGFVTEDEAFERACQIVGRTEATRLRRNARAAMRRYLRSI